MGSGQGRLLAGHTPRRLPCTWGRKKSLTSCVKTPYSGEVWESLQWWREVSGRSGATLGRLWEVPPDSGSNSGALGGVWVSVVHSFTSCEDLVRDTYQRPLASLRIARAMVGPMPMTCGRKVEGEGIRGPEEG